MPLSKFIQFHECKQVNGANPPLSAALVRRGTARLLCRSRVLFQIVRRFQAWCRGLSVLEVLFGQRPRTFASAVAARAVDRPAARRSVAPSLVGLRRHAYST
jgi:hypothetical protein